MDLIIVESPTKARTLAKFLGQDWQVTATMGHVRDLPGKKMGIKINLSTTGASEGQYKFEPEYVSNPKQKEKMADISQMAEKAGKIYLATDPDREGEAIAFHVAEILKNSNLKFEIRNFKRVTFHEITEKAVKEALNNPKDIDMQLVNAQQARRITDRLVGYKLSPLLWSKVRRGLSAGRVQSVVVRLIVEKEREIEAFKAEEYWDIFVTLSKLKVNSEELIVKLVESDDKKMRIGNGEEAKIAENELRIAEYQVSEVEKKDFRRVPPPPFTTSTLQQTVGNRFGWSAKKTMQIAQSLYEQGNITYHRTDSTNISTEAIMEVTQMIKNTYGEKYSLSVPRFYKTKDKVAQEAHEAIRPTNVTAQAANLDGQLNKDEHKLYDLIWKRFTACQMAEVRGESVKVKVKAGKYGLETRGETIIFDGWTKLTNNDSEPNTQSVNGILPELSVREKLEFIDLKKEQKFTQPPARYNEASIIKTLEEMGIGRPSTYAPTLSTVLDRQYVEKYEKRLKPTALGVAVNDFLVTNFANVLDYKFTAKLENELDDIASGTRTWEPVVSDFYSPFEKDFEDVKLTAARVKVQVEETGEKCPKCSQGEVVVRIGKFGKFLACSRFPECDYKANYVNKTGLPCPKCGGEVIMRKTRSRKNFYGCVNYPKCDFASWTRPAPKATEGDAKPAEKVPEEEITKVL